MTQPTSKIAYLVADRGNSLRRHLEKVPGMKSVAGHKWGWTVGERAADVIVESGEAISVSLDVADGPSNGAALEANRHLPGNLRYATGRRRSRLVADTQLDGEVHLLRTFDELKGGILFALGHDRPFGGHKHLTSEDVHSAIAASRWPDGDIVQLDNAWEFSARLRGNATPVRAVIDGTELCMYRRVVADMGAGLTRDAVGAQALRFNDRLRHARLAAIDGAVVAESRLHCEQLTSAWLETAVWAVAVACRHTEVVLNILAEDHDIAGEYTAMFLRENH